MRFDRRTPAGPALLTAAVFVTLAACAAPARAHSPVFVIADTTEGSPRLAVAPGSLPLLAGEVVLNFAPSGPYAGKFVTDLPGYDATLFPFGSYPGTQVRLEREGFPAGFGMYAAPGSTVSVLTSDGAQEAVVGHKHFVHHAAAAGVYRLQVRYVDGSSGLRPSRTFTVVFRAARAGIDTDGDGVADAADNCINVANTNQSDLDADNVGDLCDCCPLLANRDQRDLDNDGACDACRCGGDPPAPADHDCDGDSDLHDFAMTQACGGPDALWPDAACLFSDLDDDEDVDAIDVFDSLACMSGPAVLVAPDCLGD